MIDSTITPSLCTLEREDDRTTEKQTYPLFTTNAGYCKTDIWVCRKARTAGLRITSSFPPCRTRCQLLRFWLVCRHLGQFDSVRRHGSWGSVMICGHHNSSGRCHVWLLVLLRIVPSWWLFPSAHRLVSSGRCKPYLRWTMRSVRARYRRREMLYRL